jgi:hypothetical protein
MRATLPRIALSAAVKRWMARVVFPLPPFLGQNPYGFHVVTLPDAMPAGQRTKEEGLASSFAGSHEVRLAGVADCQFPFWVQRM